MLCFFTGGDYGDAGESAGCEQGCVGIGSDGDVGFESERGSAIENCAGNFIQRSE